MHGFKPWIKPCSPPLRFMRLIIPAALIPTLFITAGAKQKPCQSRIDLVQTNIDIFKDIIAEVVTTQNILLF